MNHEFDKIIATAIDKTTLSTLVASIKVISVCETVDEAIAELTKWTVEIEAKLT